MTATATPPATRATLTHLAQAGADRITAQLRRALPGDDQQKPSIAAFNSSI